jgi:hypothetical protein
MEKIDICMTATIRHSLLNDTLDSFTKNMLIDKDRYRLIINIDPIGEKIKRINAILQIAQTYFSEVVYNIPETPGFTKAVQWCWSQTKHPLVFHLEDDWTLLCKINIDSMIDILNKYENLVSLRLNKENTGKSKHGAKFGFVYHPKISLNPTLFKGEFIRNIFPLMDLSKNPEKQLRVNKTKLGKYLSKFNHGIYTKDSVDKIVLDIGRDWMKKSKFTKKTGFTNWEYKK